MTQTTILNAPEGSYRQSVIWRDSERVAGTIMTGISTPLILASHFGTGMGVFNTIAALGTAAAWSINRNSARWHGHQLTPRQTETNLKLTRNAATCQMMTAATLVPSSMADVWALQTARQKYAANDPMLSSLCNLGTLYLVAATAAVAVNGVHAYFRRRNVSRNEALLAGR